MTGGRGDFRDPVQLHTVKPSDLSLYRGPVDDGAVGGDRVLALLHHGHLAAAVIGGVCQTVDRAALRTGRDGHTGHGLGALHAVDCACPQQVLLHLLKTDLHVFIICLHALRLFLCGVFCCCTLLHDRLSHIKREELARAHH